MITLIYNSSSRFQRFLDKLPSVAAEAKHGLDAEPKSFEKLNGLIKFLQGERNQCAFEHFYPKAQKVLNGEAFQDFPGALQRLTPLALSYVQALEPVEAALDSDPICVEDLRNTLSVFIEAHRQFRELFTIECQNASPGAPFTVISRYPNALRLYFTAFLNQLCAVSHETYTSWRESIEAMGEETLELFPRLAIHYLLENPQRAIPELFSDHEAAIADLRLAYRQLDSSQQTALLETLRYEGGASVEPADGDSVESVEGDPLVHALFLRISGLCSDIQTANRTVFNGVVRMIYKEAAKMFALLDHINLRQLPETREIESRTVFLALLKQDALTADQLPFDFSGRDTGGNIQGETLAAHGRYQDLSPEERELFDTLFMAGECDPENYPSPLNDLLRDWGRVRWLWGSHRLFPLHQLATVAYERSQAR